MNNGTALQQKTLPSLPHPVASRVLWLIDKTLFHDSFSWKVYPHLYISGGEEEAGDQVFPSFGALIDSPL